MEEERRKLYLVNMLKHIFYIQLGQCLIFCLGKTSLAIPGAVTPSSSPIFLLQGQKMVSYGKSSQFMTKVEAGDIDRAVGSTVRLRFRKSIFGHQFQTIRKLPSNEFNFHTEVVNSI